MPGSPPPQLRLLDAATLWVFSRGSSTIITWLGQRSPPDGLASLTNPSFTKKPQAKRRKLIIGHKGLETHRHVE